MARKILIVDDQEDILLILEREFRRVPGLTVYSATKYEEALQRVGSRGIDLVISDVRLGRESGFDLIREVNRTYPGTGAILMSAYRSASNRQQADELGVVLFLEKPFQVPKLIEAVNDYFQKKENPEPAASVAEPMSDPTQESAMLTHFKLQDLVQLFCLNGRNILITVGTGTGNPGEIYIQRGNVIHADWNGQTGDEGFLSIMQIPNPILKVRDWAEPVPVTIGSSWVHLLLQAAVHVDHLPEDQQASGLG